MPYRQKSHEQRRGRAESDKRYDDTQRATTSPLAFAREVHSSGRWRKVRHLILTRRPLCADPYGHHREEKSLVVATDVDHILGLAIRPDLAFVLENLQGLCRACHARKSAQERQSQ